MCDKQGNTGAVRGPRQFSDVGRVSVGAVASPSFAMLSAIRVRACRTRLPAVSHSFASVTTTEGLIPADGRAPPPPAVAEDASSPITIQQHPDKVPVRADHGLYSFFRRKPELIDANGEDAYMTLDRTAEELTRFGGFTYFSPFPTGFELWLQGVLGRLQS